MRLVTAHVPNAQGMLAKITTMLSEAEVNIQGFSADANRLRILTDSGLAVVRALHDIGIAATEHAVIAVQLDNTPGQLADLTGRLADAGVNIELAFGTTTGRSGTIYLRVSDLDKAQDALMVSRTA